MEVKDRIKISDDFSKTPGARYRDEGEFSGQQFLEELLKPKFEKAVNENYLLQIDLDDVWGFPSSFISGSFGKLSIDKGSEIILKHIIFKSDQNKMRVEKIINEIRSPRKK